MTQLLLKLFVKDHSQTDSPKVRAAIGKLSGAVGIVCNLLLFAGKLNVPQSKHSLTSGIY